MLNQSEPNVILTAHATKVNRPEPNWTEPQKCLVGRNHAFNIVGVVTCSDNSTRRLVTCPWIFFSIHFIITLHSSTAATSASQYKKKN